MDAATAEQVKEGQKKIWGSGDWPGFAPIIQSIADEVVAEMAVGEGDDFLDVATGSGNAAIAAAERGAAVTGLDLVPELIDAARSRFASAGLEAELLVGNAEELPFADASFDRVVSIFGTMFAPRHQMAADELVRVARPGARIAFTAWTPEGLNGQMFKTIGEHMPPPPEGFQPPAMWGNEEHVRELFAGAGLELGFEKRMARWEWESLEAFLDHCEQKLGPIVVAKEVLEPEGRWQAARDALAELEESYNEADDGSMRAGAEYLLTTISVAA